MDMIFFAPFSITTPASSFGAIGGEILAIAPTTNPQRKKRKKECDIC
jgi:hypothetical protein